MINFCDMSDLEKNFSSVKETVFDSLNPVVITENGENSMVLMSYEMYESLVEGQDTEVFSARLSNSEVFEKLKDLKDNR